MIIRILGALLIIITCGSFGYSMVATHKRTLRILRQLMNSFEYLTMELQYRMLPLPDLLMRTAEYTGGIVGQFYKALASEIEKQISPNVAICADAALTQVSNLPEPAVICIAELCKSLGHFTIEGQLNVLENVKLICDQKIAALVNNQDARLRSYQTLALCTGAAVVIILI